MRIRVTGYGFEGLIAESYRLASDIGEYSKEKLMMQSLSAMLSDEKFKGQNMSAAMNIGSFSQLIHKDVCDKDARKMAASHSHDP